MRRRINVRGTLVSVYACSAVHSALLVGLLKAKMTGRSLNFPMSVRICSVKAPGTAATPGLGDETKHSHTREALTNDSGGFHKVNDLLQGVHRHMGLSKPCFVGSDSSLGTILKAKKYKKDVRDVGEHIAHLNNEAT